MLTTKNQWRTLALGLATIYISFVLYLAFSGDIISRDECPLVPDSTVLFKLPPPE